MKALLSMLFVPSLVLAQSKTAKATPVVPLKPFTAPSWAIPSAPAPARLPTAYVRLAGGG